MVVVGESTGILLRKSLRGPKEATTAALELSLHRRLFRRSTLKITAFSDELDLVESSFTDFGYRGIYV